MSKCSFLYLPKMGKFLFVLCLFCVWTNCNAETSSGYDIKVHCDCDKKQLKKHEWKTDRIDPNWTVKLNMRPPEDVKTEEDRLEDGALGETRTHTF